MLLAFVFQSVRRHAHHMELVDHQSGVRKVWAVRLLERAPHIGANPFHTVSIREVPEEGLHVRLGALLEHVEHAVGGEIGDDAAIATSKVDLVDPHDHRGLVADGRFQLLNQILGDVLDRVDRKTGLFGQSPERHAETALPDSPDQSLGRSSPFIQKGQVQGHGLAAGLAAVARPINHQPHRLHLLRGIGELDSAVPMPIQRLAALRAGRRGGLDDLGGDGDDPLRTLKVHRPHARQVQKIKHSGHPDRWSDDPGSAHR